MSTATPLTIRLSPADNVVVARADLLPGAEVAAEKLAAKARVPAGHKMATKAIAAGQPVRKFNQIIGFATEDDGSQAHHIHTCTISRSWATSSATMPSAIRRPSDAVLHRATPRRPSRATAAPEWPRRHAQLHRHRHHGELLGRDQRAYIADTFTSQPTRSHQFPNIDGVGAFVHSTVAVAAWPASGLEMAT